MVDLGSGIVGSKLTQVTSFDEVLDLFCQTGILKSV
jgi:hypothetical protein